MKIIFFLISCSLLLFFSCSSIEKQNHIYREIAEQNNLCPDINKPTLSKISDNEFYDNYKICCKDDLNTPTVLSAYNHPLKGCEIQGRDKLTTPERLSLLAYTSNCYVPIKKLLRTGTGVEACYPVADKIFAALQKFHSTDKPVLYRLTDFATVNDLPKKGSIFNYKSFMSTSESKVIFDSPFFPNANTHIFIKPAVKSSGKKIMKCSVNTCEEEVLFPPTTKFKVLNVGKSDIKPGFARLDFEEISN